MLIRHLGRADYEATVAAMREFTASRTETTPDELWLCEHAPIYTLGVGSREEHLHESRGIPVMRTNRGGQVTYHGPGQVVAYPLVDLQRLGIYVKEYVFRIEQAVLRTLEASGVTGHRVPGAPGIYVRPADPACHAVLRPDPLRPFTGLAKIAALGVKVSRHCAYHGVALNVAMDLSPFRGIDPCGYAGLQTIDMATLGVSTSWDAVARRLADKLEAQLAP